MHPTMTPADPSTPHPGARQRPDRNLGLDLLRVTEAAAMAAARWVGRGDKEGGDGAAVDAMRAMLGTVPMRGRVVIGEGEKDQAPMLYTGEEVGSGQGPRCDVAVDPVDGTTLLSKGQPNAIAVIAAAPAGAMRDLSAAFYMRKLATGPEAADAVDLEAPAAENVRAVARAKGVRVEDVTVVVLDRPRHEELVREVRGAGARIRLIPDGDVAGAIMTARPGTGVDLLLGVGGAPEAVIAAAALRALGGCIQGRLEPAGDAERERALAAGLDLGAVHTTEDLVAGDDAWFCATGVTDGELLPGVRFDHGRVHTTSLVLRARSGTSRVVESEHRLDRLAGYSAVDYYRNG